MHIERAILYSESIDCCIAPNPSLSSASKISAPDQHDPENRARAHGCISVQTILQTRPLVSTLSIFLSETFLPLAHSNCCTSPCKKHRAMVLERGSCRFKRSPPTMQYIFELDKLWQSKQAACSNLHPDSAASPTADVHTCTRYERQTMR